jgi:hemolysin II
MKKVKTALKCLTVASVVMAVSLASPTQVVSADSRDFVQKLEKGAKVHNSFHTYYDRYHDMKTSLKVSFIEDPYADKKIAVITSEGSNIGADTEITGGGYSATLKWPSAYGIGMKLGNDDSAQLHTVSPVNVIDSKSVSSTVGYTVGGSINSSMSATEGPGVEAGISGNVSWSTTVSYNQPDYKTILEKNTDKQAAWKVGFVSAMNQGWGPYDRSSHNTLYGNQLFMKSRSYNWGRDNFISKDQMPALAGYGFSPSVVAVITADKDETTSDLTVTSRRVSDNYNISWVASKWWGGNSNEAHNEQSITNYTLDWDNHKLTYTGAQGNVKTIDKGYGKLIFTKLGDTLHVTSENNGYGISHKDKQNWAVIADGKRVYTFNEKSTVDLIAKDIQKQQIKGKKIEVVAL